MAKHVPPMPLDWYDGFSTDFLIRDIEDSRRMIEKRRAKGFADDDSVIGLLKDTIATARCVLEYRGVSDVVHLVEPMIVFDLDTMTGWLEVLEDA